jgi:hypothetical protein
MALLFSRVQYEKIMGHYFLQVLTEASVDGVIKYIQEHNCRNVITMAGAGISTCK